MRIDKWLWAARFFKTRSLAAQACELGRVTSRGQWVKPSRDVRAGDRLLVRNPGGDFEIQVLGLSDQRGPATTAQTLYEETPESRSARALVAEQRRLVWQPEANREGRPSKRDRRQIGRLRERS